MGTSSASRQSFVAHLLVCSQHGTPPSLGYLNSRRARGCRGSQPRPSPIIRVRRHPSTAKPTTSTCHQAMSQSGRDSDSEDSNCIYWDQKGLGTRRDVYLHRFGGGFHGPPLASMSQSLLEAGSSSDDSS